MSNTFGTLFRLTSFGESHGEAIGGIIDGCPSGIIVDMEFIQQELNRRRPGQSSLTTQRKEPDAVRLLSGIFDGKTTGMPIGFIVENTQQRSSDYDHLKNVYRPSHADYTYDVKYGMRDYRGGGRSSARETIARVVAGAFAKLALRQIGVKITAYTSQIGNIALNCSYMELNLDETEKNPVRCPDADVARIMSEKIIEVSKNGDSIGGIVTCVIQHVPAGLGEPVFDKMQACLAHAMLSINAAKGFDYGSGFDGVTLTGSQANDTFYVKNNNVHTLSNNSGGIQGGISNGEDIYFRVVFKPTATISISQKTIDKDMQPVTLNAHGRHDPCVVPRAVPIVEAMAAMTVLDQYLLQKNAK